MSTVQAREIRVLFFASLREAVETDTLSIDITGPVSLDELLARLKERLPPTAMTALTAENVRLAVNQTLINPPVMVQPGDEVAFLPPVTGG